MKSLLQWVTNKIRSPKKISVYQIIICSLLAALIYALQIAMSPLPNIELVSFLVIIYTIYFTPLTPYILAVFILLEGLTFGFGLWWVNYLYMWPILALVTYIFRKQKSPLAWAIVSGTFGLAFGALCSIPWMFMGGIQTGIAYWVSGIPFDIAHCVGNFILMLILFHPISACFKKLQKISKI